MELRKMRERLGLTQVQLAEALKVSQVTISRWETDAMAIQQPTILRLALEHLRCGARSRASRP
jgi:transcriptional regulator with XRE-family HTH domain